jgi:hypothetical protein
MSFVQSQTPNPNPNPNPNPLSRQTKGIGIPRRRAGQVAIHLYYVGCFFVASRQQVTLTLTPTLTLNPTPTREKRRHDDKVKLV